MASLIITIEEDIRRLRAALSKADEEQIDRELPILQRDLLSNDKYQAVGDERLLAEALRLLTQCIGDELQPQLDSLRRHLSKLQTIHGKLYSILDHTVGLDELLFTHLDQWPGYLNERIGCAFDANVKSKLQAARSIRKTEAALQSFLALYFEHLTETGYQTIVAMLQPNVTLALEGYTHNHTWTVHGLFVVQGRGEVHGLKIRPVSHLSGSIQSLDQLDLEMQNEARRALACVNNLWPQTRLWDFQWEISRQDIPYEGESIGLALAIGILAEVESFDIDPYTAFTGHVIWDTAEIKHIGQLDRKLEAAKELGIRRVFIPRDNADEIRNVQGLTVVPVGSVEEAKRWIEDRSFVRDDATLDQLAEAKIRQVEISLRDQRIHPGSYVRKPDQVRVPFSDLREEVLLIVYHGRKGLNPVVQGPPGSSLKQKVEEATNRVFGAKPEPTKASKAERLRDRYFVTDPATKQKIEKYIFGRPDSQREKEDNCIYRARIQRGAQTVYVRQFSKGTLTIDGEPPLYNEIDGDIQALLGLSELPTEEKDAARTRLDAQVKAVEDIDLGENWVGTDEAGKGDYFGPLVSAAVLVDRRTAGLLEGIGVKDSKALSDKRNRELAPQINQICEKHAQVVIIPPARYNQLYEQFHKEGKNLNWLLAWAHTRALENILERFSPEHLTVVVDKFGDEKYIQSKLLSESRRANLNLVQLPKAEVNVAVAAASILARAQFLQSLEEISKNHGVEFLKGASDPRIVEIAKQVISRRGEAELAKVAKLHFKTTQKVLGSPAKRLH